MIRWNVLCAGMLGGVLGVWLGASGCAKSNPSGGITADGDRKPGADQPVVWRSGEYVHIGEPLKLSTRAPVDVAAVLADPEKFTGQDLRILGTIEKVCEKKGCWVTLTDPSVKKELFVKFTCSAEGGRIVPMEAVGKLAIVEGRVEIKEISEADARHYAEDAGASAEEIARIVGPQKQIQVRSPAVQIAMK